MSQIPNVPTRDPILERVVEYQRLVEPHGIEVEVVYLASQMCMEIRVTVTVWMDSGQTITAVGKAELDEVILTGTNDAPEAVYKGMHKTVIAMLEALGENITGKYPATRLYADINLNSSNGETLLFNPDVKVEGWIHNKYRGHWPKEGEIEPFEGPTISSEMGTPIPAIRQKALATVPQDESERLDAMAQTVKRKVVKSAPIQGFDPSKVKKPLCPVHREQMRFHPVKQKWVCDTPNCKMVSRPTKDEDDKSVQIGKGETSMRIVCTEDETVVLLISDDNLAIDITGLVGNLENFFDSIGALDLANTADQNGSDRFVDGTPRQITFSVRVGAIGVAEMLNKHSI